MQSSSSSGPLAGLNHTELYQTCRRVGLNVRPNATIPQLIAYIMGDEVPPPLDEATHPIDSWRHGIIGFLLDHWTTLEPQIKCPAKNLRHPTEPNLRPCFGCVDAQVITCVTQNDGKVEHLIQLHRPSQEPTGVKR